MSRFEAALLMSAVAVATASGSAADGPVARWKLAADVKNAIPGGADGQNHGVTFEQGTFPQQSAKFDGRGNHITVPHAESLDLGTGDFTISLWVNTATESDDDLGDLISQFDPKSRTGFHLSLRNNAGVTHSQANYRQLQFGIDADSEPVFTDEGRPGKSVFGQSMAVHDGALFVGTCEPGSDQAGHVYRYDGTNRWIDCGSPDKANSITAMAAWNGSLYVGSGKYRLGGSKLSESENPHLGGRIFRYLGEQNWEEVGQLPEMEAVGGMVVFRGKLYVGSLYKPAAFFRYEGDKQWTPLAVPNGKRVEALGVFNGCLWATGYDEGNVYRFDGEEWTDLGRVGEPENTQTYAFATYQGQLQVATWRTGKVFAWDNDAWQDRGRLGEELEVMGMLTHNGCLYGGTLPAAQIYRYDGGQAWTALKQLDLTETQYRRVWTMAQFQGKLFATTLPSGHVWSMLTGECVTWDHEFPSGWRHVAAQRKGDTLRLFVDGMLVGETTAGEASSADLNSEQPWKIGAGSGDYFHGSLADVRVHRRALSLSEIRELAEHKAD
ncbi:MAG TPA: LamG domain-containing protein [Planctomycetaceae bacterium]|nr:LamG domain-containing protein [Planctomycetaceae bacterium]